MPSFINGEVLVVRTGPIQQQGDENDDRMNSMMHGVLLRETS
jgi:hypothetical protein